MSESPKVDEDGNEVCPECGRPLIYQGGCIVCPCGWSGCG